MAPLRKQLTKSKNKLKKHAQMSPVPSGLLSESSSTNKIQGLIERLQGGKSPEIREL